MELREYWQTVWRRRQIIIPLVAITFIASAIANLVLPPTYKTDTTVHVQAVLPPVVPNPYYDPAYFRTIQSEYLTDDLGVVVKSRTFAERVAAQIESRFGQEIDVRDILDAITTTKKLHRTLKITVATGNYALTKRIGEAVDDVLQRDGDRLVTRDYQLISINVIDPPRDPTSPSPLRRLLDVLLHSAVALVVGTGLAFLLQAIDDRIRSEADAEQTIGWPVIGAIPMVLDEEEARPSRLAGLLDTLRRPFQRGGGPSAPRARRALRNVAARRLARDAARSRHRL